MNDCFGISEIQTTNNVTFTLAKNFVFSFMVYKILSYLLSFENFSSTKRLSCLLNIANVSFSSSLNRLNALSPYQKFVHFDNAYNLSPRFI